MPKTVILTHEFFAAANLQHKSLLGISNEGIVQQRYPVFHPGVMWLFNGITVHYVSDLRN